MPRRSRGLLYYRAIYMYVPNPGSQDSRPRLYIDFEYHNSAPNRTTNEVTEIRLGSYQPRNNLSDRRLVYMDYTHSGYVVEHYKLSPP